jgi:hypothetical protein
MNVSLTAAAVIVGLTWFKAPPIFYLVRKYKEINDGKEQYAGRRYIIAGLSIFAVLLVLGLCLGPMDLGPLGRWP